MKFKLQYYKVDSELVQIEYPHFNKEPIWNKYILSLNIKNTKT